jgi:glycogen debranching enzyme
MAFEVSSTDSRNFEQSSRLEWLLAGKSGAFACGTVSGASERRLHGWLGERTPEGGRIYLAGFETYATSRGQRIGLSTSHHSGAVHPQGFQTLGPFKVGRICEWIHELGSLKLSKKLVIHDTEIAATVVFKNLGGQPVQLNVRPLVCNREKHVPFRQIESFPDRVEFPENEMLVRFEDRTLAIGHAGAERSPSTGWHYRFQMDEEEAEGAEPLDDLYCPGELNWLLEPGQEAVIVVALDKLPKPVRPQKQALSRRLIDKLKTAASLHCMGPDENPNLVVRHPDGATSTREALVALPGLSGGLDQMEGGRLWLLNLIAGMKDGALPELDPKAAHPHRSSDAGLWMMQTAFRMLNESWDDEFAEAILEAFGQVVKGLSSGTESGLFLDENDGLVCLDKEDDRLTWMNSCWQGWCSVPRHGRPIEVNSLWISALHTAEWICGKIDRDGLKWRLAAEKAESNFRSTFWNERHGGWLDTAGPDDATLRASLLIALACPFSPIKGEAAERALDLIDAHLLTPYGVRSCSPAEFSYEGRLNGPPKDLAAAAHRGAVHSWLWGSYCDAVLRIRGAVPTGMFNGLEEMLTTRGIGGISELRSGDAPHTPHGCVWHAPSVAEALRAVLIVGRPAPAKDTDYGTKQLVTR